MQSEGRKLQSSSTAKPNSGSNNFVYIICFRLSRLDFAQFPCLSDSICTASYVLWFSRYSISQRHNILHILEQKCTKRWKSLRDKFAREMKLCQESRWRYFKQMQFLVDSIRQYRESLLGKCNTVQQNTNQVAQVDPNQQQQQPQQQAVVDIFAQPFNSSATTSAQAITHPHVTGDTQLATTGKDQKPYFYEPPLKRERAEDDNHDNMLNTIKIFQNSMSQAVSAEDQSFGMVVTDMLNTLGVRQKAEAKVHIIKYLTDMQLLAQHNKY